VARAKRTNRAEARRRYRARMAAEAAGETPPEDEDADSTASSAPTARRGPQPPGRQPLRRPADEPPPRPGLGTAFRAAFRPANLREDLAALPRLLLHRSVWLPAAISLGTAALFIATRGTDAISFFLYQYFVVPPPIGAIFLSGFLAPRASYLTGAIAGLFGAIALAILVAAVSAGALGPTGAPGSSPSPSGSPATASGSPAPSGSAATGSPAASPPTSASPAGSAGVSAAPSAAPSPTASGQGGTPSPQQLGDTVSYALILSPTAGVIFGAAAAWYRRFLAYANPNRGQRRQQPQRGRGNQRRR
jgi:hypothetical protein